MTGEIYRPGADTPMIFPEGGLFEVQEKSGDSAVLVSLRYNEGFKEYPELSISEFLSQTDKQRKEAEEDVLVYKLGNLLQLADGVIVKAT